MLDYPMALRTDRPLPAVREEVRTASAALIEALALGPGMLRADVHDVDHPVTAEVYAELLGGAPATCRVMLSVENKTEDEAQYLAARGAMAVLAAQVAHRTDADACLTFQLDRVVMRRRDGRLELLDWFPQWAEPDVLARVPQPYVVTSEDGRL